MSKLNFQKFFGTGSGSGLTFGLQGFLAGDDFQKQLSHMGILAQSDHSFWNIPIT